MRRPFGAWCGEALDRGAATLISVIRRGVLNSGPEARVRRIGQHLGFPAHGH